MPKPPRTEMGAERRREILMEAGYACAIPACKQTPVEIHHIDGDRTNHAFENLIALCRNDHGRAGEGTIDNKAVRIYKRNLGFVSGRYSDMERRLLKLFAEHPDEEPFITMERRWDFEFYNLLEDGLLAKTGEEIHMQSGPFTQGLFQYGLTEPGIEWLDRWQRGLPISP